MVWSAPLWSSRARTKPLEVVREIGSELPFAYFSCRGAERAGYEVVAVPRKSPSGIRKAKGKQPVERGPAMVLVQARQINAVIVTRMIRRGDSGPVGSGRCRILHVDFRKERTF
jgi:hypothetical protein